MDVDQDFDLEEARNDEIDALRSMYVDDFEEVWRRAKNTPYHFKIRVKPAGAVSAEDAHCCVKLDLTLGLNYPHKQPQIKIEKVKGLSDALLKKLSAKVKKSAVASVGHVMIYDLVLEVEEFLAAHNKEQQTFHEQFLDRQTKENERKRQKEKEQRKKKHVERQIAQDLLQGKIDKAIRKKKQAREEERLDARPVTPSMRELLPTSELPPPLRLSRRAISGGSASEMSGATSPVIMPMEMDLTDADFSPKLAADQEMISFPGLDDDDIPEQEHKSVPDDFLLSEERPSSRYLADFDEIGQLGSGGFGVVVKVRNRLDGQIYAIKKIRLRRNRPSVNKKILREVTTIARLQHQYIVRYYQAWIEGSEDPSTPQEKDSGNFSGDDDFDTFGNDDDDWLDGTISTSTTRTMHSKKKIYKGDSIFPESESSGSSEEGPEQHLYIQMEYCPKNTLRDSIDRGDMTPSLIWRVFHQMLEALEFIQKKGTIHRDIKPQNVFIDQHNNVKLGDFGLAMPGNPGTGTTGGIPGSERASLIPRNSSGASLMDQRSSLTLKLISGSPMSVTEIVGTPFYRAPEQEIPGRRITHKADMFSLGILLSEMWTTFDTGMERILWMQSLRDKGKVRADFRERFTKDSSLSEVDAVVPDLIESLIHRKPASRPSATELLQSGKIPFEIEEAYMGQALNEVTRPDSMFRSQVIKSLFNADVALHVDFTYDSLSVQNLRNSRLNPTNPASHWPYGLQMNVFERLSSIFRSHGAIEIDTPLLTPKLSNFGHKNDVTLMDGSGTIVSLPFTLGTPFARYIAQNGIIGIRRYCISRVYRQSAAGCQPKQLFEANLDFHCPSKGNKEMAAVLGAELISVVQNVISVFARALGDVRLRVSHSVLVEAALEKCAPLVGEDAPADWRKEVKQLVSQLGRVQWPSIRRSLLFDKNISEKCVDWLHTFSHTKGSFSETAQQVLTMFPDNNKVKHAVEQLRSLFKYLKHFDCSSIIFDCGLIMLSDWFSGPNGLMFQAVTTSKEAPFDLIAQGGRYDSLIERHRPPSQPSTPIAAMGVSIAVEKIIHALCSQEFPMTSLLPDRPDSSVLLFCPRGDLVVERVKKAKELWNAGIQTEYIIPVTVTMPEVQGYCQYMGIQWLVVLRKKVLKSTGMVSLHNLLSRSKKFDGKWRDLNWLTDVDSEMVLFKDLCKVLRSKFSGGGHSSDLSLTNSTNARVRSASIDDTEFTPVVIMAAGTKTRAKQKATRKAQNAIDPFTSGLPSESVACIAVDLSLDIVRSCSSACLPLVFDLQSFDAINNLINEHSGRTSQLLVKLAKQVERSIKNPETQHLFVYSMPDDRFDLINVDAR
eukprot:68803_1